jgi:hypothetical protein
VMILLLAAGLLRSGFLRDIPAQRSAVARLHPMTVAVSSTAATTFTPAAAATAAPAAAHSMMPAAMPAAALLHGMVATVAAMVAVADTHAGRITEHEHTDEGED